MIDKKENSSAPAESGAATTEEGFLERWSRRKTDALRDTEPAAVSPPMVAESVEPPAEAEKILTDEDMPPLEELGDDSDYSGFLSAGVSEQLRQMALKKLFHSAKFNVCDGLDDYAEDYTKFEPLGDIVTADMKYEMKQAMEKALAAESDAGAESTADLQEGGSLEADEAPDQVEAGGESGSDPAADDGEKDVDDARLV